MTSTRLLPWCILAVPLFVLLASLLDSRRRKPTGRILQTTASGFLTVPPTTAPLPTERELTNSLTLAPTLPPVTIRYQSDDASTKLVEVVINFGSIVLLMYLLRLLLRMAEEQIDSVPHYRLKGELFQSADLGQNWNWDFILVTAVKPEGFVPENETQRRFTMLRIVKAMEAAQLETCQFKSQDWKRIIIKVRATAKRLKDQADKLNTRLRLDEKEVKKRLLDGQADGSQPGEWIVYPRKDGWLYHGREMFTAIRDTENQCQYDYFEYMYGAYDGDERFQALYHKYSQTSSIFRSVDRIKLILSILKWPANDQGAGLALEKLIRQKAILFAFPLHDRMELQSLQKRWLVYWGWPWDQPFNRIKDYFGEKVALYFAFLGHYTSSVMVAAIVGTVFYGITIVDSPNSTSIPTFCVFMSVWATLFVEFWKRKQARYAMAWGMEGVEDSAEVRPEFAANRRVLVETSPVTGEKELHFPQAIARMRRLFSLAIMAVCTTMVLLVVIVIFFIKAILTTKTNLFGTRKSFSSANVSNKPVRNWGILRRWEVIDVSSQIAGVIVALLNAVQIFALENFFSDLAKRLTDYEAHRTDTLYEDSLTGKVFALQFINSFTSYMYIGFFKEVQSANYELQYGRGAYACVGSCMAELRTQLGAIFISKVILANVKDIAIPYTTYTAIKLAETRKREAQDEAQGNETVLDELRRFPSAESSGEEVKTQEQHNISTTQSLRPRESEAQDKRQRRIPTSFVAKNDDSTGNKAHHVPLARRHQPPQAAAVVDTNNVEVRQLSPAEEQMRLEEYNILLGPFADYRDLVIIYGYTVLFVAAFPLAPLMALVNSYIQIRSDAWHISIQCQRPWPSNAEDIGTWSEIVELMSYLAVLINSVIIVYTGTFLDNFVLSNRLLAFIGLYHGLFVLKFIVAILVEDVPSDVRLQLQRQHFIEDKLLRMTRDDVIEVEGDFAQKRNIDLNPDVTLYDQDKDVVYLDYPGFQGNC